jgi:hypothetical protein
MRDRVDVATMTALGSLCGHHGGDYLVQTDRWAAPPAPDQPPLKQQHNPKGRRALAAHVATYTATQAVTKAAFYRSVGIRVPVLAQLAGAVTEAVLHAVIDDGRLLAKFARATGKPGFHDKAPGGRAHMDQAAHHQLQIPAGVFATVAVARLVAHRRTRVGGRSQ